jgi:hypothetical protein
VPQYAYVYNTGVETVQVGSDVAFDTNGLMTSGITHAPTSTDIHIVNGGTYKVTFSISGTESNQFAVFVGGVLVPGSIYGSGAGTQQNSGQAIVTVTDGAILTLRNHASAAAVGLQPAAGGGQPSSNASVLIERLS